MAETEAAALAAVTGNDGEKITVKGTEVTIAPLSIDQIAQILSAIDALAEKGVRIDSLSALAGGEPAGIRRSFSQTQFILRGGEDLRNIVAIATSQPPQFIGSLNFVQFAILIGKVWTVNKDFFDQNRTALLAAFGLDDQVLVELKTLFASIKSLLNSWPGASQTSDDSPSDKLKPSTEQLNESDATE